MGMLRVVFIYRGGNHKSTFIMTVIKQEKLEFILVILYIQEYLCVYFTRVSEDFQFRVSGSRNNRNLYHYLFLLSDFSQKLAVPLSGDMNARPFFIIPCDGQ